MNGLMEIALLSHNSLKIRGKGASIVIGQPDKSSFQALLLLETTPVHPPFSEEQIIIIGPGEYEVGGIKIVGVRADTGMIYTITVDAVTIAVGKLSSLHQMQSKLQEYDIVIAHCDTADESSFLTSLTSHVVMLYGDKKEEVAQTFGKEHIKRMSKYSSTKEKLPTEVETVLLANG